MIRPSEAALDSPRLRSREAFTNNLKTNISYPSEYSAIGIVGAYLGAYCAGMNGRASDEDVLAALDAQPDERCAANATIRWLFGSLRVQKVANLVAWAGIPLGRIADHVRSIGVNNPHLINWLNQFAV